MILEKVRSIFLDSENKHRNLLILSIALNVFTIVFSLLKMSNTVVIMLIISSICLLVFTKRIVKNYVCIPFFFAAFHVIYGISGVISVTWLGGLSSTYGNVFNIFPYSVAYSLCTIFLMLGIFLAHIKYKNIEYEKDNLEVFKYSEEKTKNYLKYFLFVAICGVIVTDLFELINFLRAGGFSTLTLGKAVYQARVDELIFTLPTQQISLVSVSCFSIYMLMAHLNKKAVSKKTIILFLGLMLPYVILLLYLGRRGPLLGYFLIMIICYCQAKPVIKITKKMLLITLAVYFCLGTMYGVRNHINLMFKDFGAFTEKFFSKSNLIAAYNPGTNEFGCTFGNFNRLYIIGDYEFLYGKSYVDGVINLVPSYLYQGKKPQTITYKFRDKYFPKKAQISSIASTAFSSILETYWNFWYFGAIIYMLYGFVVMWLDAAFKKKSIYCFLIYASIFPLVYTFHRSDFGHIIYESLMVIFMVYFIFAFKVFIYNRYVEKHNT